MFESEADLLQIIEKHDALIHRCVNGEFGFWEFCVEYDDFYVSYALDGHESDANERTLLKKHEEKIAPHRTISFEILGLVCSDADAERECYSSQGRFGSGEAVRRLRNVEFPS